MVFGGFVGLGLGGFVGLGLGGFVGLTCGGLPFVLVTLVVLGLTVDGFGDTCVIVVLNAVCCPPIIVVTEDVLVVVCGAFAKTRVTNCDT